MKLHRQLSWLRRFDEAFSLTKAALGFISAATCAAKILCHNMCSDALDHSRDVNEQRLGTIDASVARSLILYQSPKVVSRPNILALLLFVVDGAQRYPALEAESAANHAAESLGTQP